ncbi:Sas10/Utp3/C1D family-domain-containing protein [Aspergillus ambiguus]|uniref:small subunit rRNA maturation protein LCP5 n=1 Tax=Aspergillus ambiguus TaxID=176160 RepID=UPI003CCD6760
MAALQTEPSGLPHLSSLLENLTGCLSSAATSLPKSTRADPSDVAIEPPQDGISLLDAKSDLLLSYIQNLVFLTLIQLRDVSHESVEPDQSVRDEVVKKLIELRVYLDRGVRPLESRLKYQVDKVIKAAEDSERTERSAPKSKSRKEQGSGREDEDAASSDSEGDSEDDEEEEDIDEMAYRPNVSAFTKKIAGEAKPDRPNLRGSNDGIYRPPRIMPTALPTTESKERKDRAPPRRSNVIDEFVSAEMSSAPMAEPSIGSTIVRGGRHTKSKKEREVEAERTAYEETNFTRLAKESKKERAKRRNQGGDSGFGGEEWRGLTEGADRITKLTRRAKGSGNALEKSRKRKPTDDGPRSDGAGLGQIFEKRRKKMEGWKR